MTNRSSEFGWKSADVSISACARCKNYLGKGSCFAYDMIPDVILSNEHDHRQPYPGDKGIRFEPIGKKDKPQ